MSIFLMGIQKKLRSFKHVFLFLLLFICVVLPAKSFAQLQQNVGLKAENSQKKGRLSGISGPTYIKKGEQVALLIAINKYQHTSFLSNLKNCVNDAESLRVVLENEYGYDRFVKLYNEKATYWEIKAALERLTKELSVEDSLLIYFSGHGSYEGNIGRWFFSDSKKNIHGLENSVVRDYVASLKAHHVAIIADSCFSGSLILKTESIKRENWREKSRRVLTSGGMQPVADESLVKKCVGHSIFACYLLESLRNRAETGLPVSLTGIFADLYDAVKNNSGGQKPQHGIFDRAGDEGGEFVFWGLKSRNKYLNELKSAYSKLLEIQSKEFVSGYEKAEALKQFHKKYFVRTWERLQPFHESIAKERRQDLPVSFARQKGKQKGMGSGLLQHYDDLLAKALDLKKAYQKRLNISHDQLKDLLKNKYLPVKERIGAGEKFLAEFSLDNVYADSVKKRIVALESGDEEQVKGRSTFKDPASGLEFVWVDGGCFLMGQSGEDKKDLIAQVGEKTYREYYADELPQHEVCVGGFYMGKYEVTVRDFSRFVDVSGYKTEAERNVRWSGCKVLENGKWIWTAEASWKAPGFSQKDHNPVTCVSWHDAVKYANWASRKGGLSVCYNEESLQVISNCKGYRLPTEAEWEYAARGGTMTSFHTGKCLSSSEANYNGNFPYKDCSKGTYRRKMVAVGSFKGNDFGLYDMHGNVWEWVGDWYGDYGKGPDTNPKGPASGSDRVLRGGSWLSVARSCRVAFRYWGIPDFRGWYNGFRLALSVSSAR